jgi:hypothetical protein
MALFRCTDKLRRALSLGALDEGNVEPGLFGEWYCLLAIIDRQKCLFFSEAETLFTFAVPAVSPSDLAHLPGLFREHLATALFDRSLGAHTFDWLIPSGPDVFAKTRSLRVLGSMNDHVKALRYRVEEQGSLARVQIRAFNRLLNETPMSYLGAKKGDLGFAVDAVHELLRRRMAS